MKRYPLRKPCYGRFICLLAAIFSLNIACSEEETQSEYSISSPDEQLSVRFWVSDSNRAHYAVLFGGTEILETSRLGLVREDADFSDKLTLSSASSVNPVQDDYEMPQGKEKNPVYEANEQTFHLSNADEEQLDIIFRVSNDGVAFRYHFPEESEEVKKISEELTSFRFRSGTRAWLQPIANVNTGFAETNPSYEEHYLEDIPTDTPSPTGAGWVYPALFNEGDTWMLITEAGLDRNYCGTRLRSESPEGEYFVGFPQEEERFPGGPVYPESTLPWSTPWRIITVGSLGTIVESTLGTDLADPAIEVDESFVEPGLASWSWALLKDESVNYDTQKEFIDYAAEMEWEYCLVDVNWDTNIGYDRIAELSAYAADKGVGLLLWYNSSGDWNETVYTPKSKLLSREDRRAEFSRLQEMGIRGIKVDFFGGDGQSMIKYYLDLFEDAADYGLLVNCHGSTLPRGWHRTYPNLMTMEAVKGFEFITFEQDNADLAPNHCAILPFTRNAFDPMDFTPMSLDEIPGIERKTTNGFELALPVLFTSGIQHIAETPEGMATVPDYVQEFLRDLPAAWEETRFIDGYPGKLAVIARRGADGWYVGGINGEDTPKSLSLDFSFLTESASSGMLITDGDERRSFVREEVDLTSSSTIRLDVKGNGGFVMYFPL